MCVCVCVPGACVLFVPSYQWLNFFFFHFFFFSSFRLVLPTLLRICRIRSLHKRTHTHPNIFFVITDKMAPPHPKKPNFPGMRVMWSDVSFLLFLPFRFLLLAVVTPNLDKHNQPPFVSGYISTVLLQTNENRPHSIARIVACVTSHFPRFLETVRGFDHWWNHTTTTIIFLIRHIACRPSRISQPCQN